MNKSNNVRIKPSPIKIGENFFEVFKDMVLSNGITLEEEQLLPLIHWLITARVWLEIRRSRLPKSKKESK